MRRRNGPVVEQPLKNGHEFKALFDTSHGVNAHGAAHDILSNPRRLGSTTWDCTQLLPAIMIGEHIAMLDTVEPFLMSARQA